ncbi:MAG: zinc ribbon domain-containing protein [Candidatus Helarchaeales archaeon]
MDLDIGDLPDHVKTNISQGEGIISTFRANVKFGKKSYSKVQCILTTEKLMIDAKKALEKLFLSDIYFTERKKNKLVIHSSLRSGEELKVIIEVLKESGEKKDDFKNRADKILKRMEISSEEDEEKQDVMIVPENQAHATKPPSSGTPPKRFCPECGARLPEGGKFCPECGAKIP